MSSQIHVHRLPGPLPEAKIFRRDPPKLFTPVDGVWGGQLCLMVGDNRFVSLSGNTSSSYSYIERMAGQSIVPFHPSEGITIVVTEEES